MAAIYETRSRESACGKMTPREMHRSGRIAGKRELGSAVNESRVQIANSLVPYGSDDTSKDTSEAEEQVAERVWSSLHLTETVDVSSL
jgi:hypothetical protein